MTTTEKAVKITAASQSNKSSQLFWETAIPASLVAAAAACLVDPDKFPAIVFLFAGLGFLLRTPLMGAMTRPIACQISETATITVEELFVGGGSEERLDRLWTASSGAIQHAMGSEILQQTLKNAIVDSTQDEDLENVILATVTKAIVKATKDESMLEALTSVAKEGLLEALRDKEFMKDSVSSLVEAILEASQDPKLKDTFLMIVTDSVQTALQDEDFVAMFAKVIKDVLSDGSMYRAGASGLIGAIMPKRSSNKKVSSSSSTTIDNDASEKGDDAISGSSSRPQA